jgi:hypothetical protein
MEAIKVVNDDVMNQNYNANAISGGEGEENREK